MIKELNVHGRIIYVSDNGIVYNSEHKEIKQHHYDTGYKYVFINYHNHLVHRLVAQAFISNYSEDIQVHHLNENKADNRVDNLKCMTILEHQRFHKQILPEVKVCEVCGKIFTPHKTKRRRAHVCSNECKIKLDKINAAKRKRPVKQLSLSGEIIKIWDSARDVQNTLGFFDSNVVKCCKHNIPSYKGFKWEYLNGKD